MSKEPSMYPDIVCPGMSGPMSGPTKSLDPRTSRGYWSETNPGMSGGCDVPKLSDNGRWATLRSGARVIVYKGQTYEIIAATSYTSRSGEVKPLLRVASFCSDCSGPFDTTAVLTLTSMRRRCFTCSPARAPRTIKTAEAAPHGWATLENVR